MRIKAVDLSLMSFSSQLSCTCLETETIIYYHIKDMFEPSRYLLESCYTHRHPQRPL